MTNADLAVPENWTDAGGHAWESRKAVDCVECPHCLFIFAAIHTSEGGYDCPNCNGCPDVRKGKE
jgi:hypothetical protein